MKLFKSERNPIWIIILFFLAMVTLTYGAGDINVHYLGHSAFVIEFDNGVSILTDYPVPNGNNPIVYSVGDFVPTIYCFSHTHPDHYGGKLADKPAFTLSHIKELDYNGITIRAIRTSEARITAKDNTSYLITYKGFKILHLGDAQANIANLSDDEHRAYLEDLFPDDIDLLLMTIDKSGLCYISTDQAVAFSDWLKPRYCMPMHYWGTAKRDSFAKKFKEKAEADPTAYQVTELETCIATFSTSEEAKSAMEIVVPQRGPFQTSGVDYTVSQVPDGFNLLPNYPNPFNPTTELQYQLASQAQVNLSIIDSQGRMVRSLVSESQPAGQYQQIWDGTDQSGALVSSGVYFCILKFVSNTVSSMQSQKMLFLK